MSIHQRQINHPVIAYFSYVRGGLLGCWPQRDDPARPYYRTVFRIFSQPAINLRYTIVMESEGVLTAPGVVSIGSVLGGRKFFTWVANLLIVFSVLVSLIFFLPDAYYSYLQPSLQSSVLGITQVLGITSTNDAQHETKFAETNKDHLESLADDEQSEESPTKTNYLSEINPDLPEGNWVIIPKIGVNTQLQQTQSAEQALNTGVWWVPGFGTPGDQELPMILAAHRFGFAWWWKNDYWKTHSFNRLPELQPGDKIEIVVEQRRWLYEIYSGEEGTEISDYDADLILYTCKYLNSPVRFFRYAKLVADVSDS